MAAARNPWCVLVAILQIAALVLFLAPATASAHGGRHHTHHDAAAASGAGIAATGHHDLDATAEVTTSPGTAEDGRGQGACCSGCCSCACHVFAEGPRGEAPPYRPLAARAMPPPSDRGYANVTLEALPEPPRPSA